jgi:hypothetical protein
MPHSIASLNHISLGEIRRLFSQLDPPEHSSLRGIFRGHFVGPAWFRKLGGPLLTVTGLGGWWGKDFDPQGKAVNLVLRNGAYKRIFPMYIVQQESCLDRKPGLALRYQADNPFPWPMILDELRRVDASLVLGMTLVDVGPLRRLPLPFILQSREAVDGL